MRPPPRISVVLTCRQPGPWLAVQLASLLRAGSRLDWELVAVVEGTDTHESRALLETFSQHRPPGRVRLLEGAGRGLAAARNLGLAHCQADLVVVLAAEERCLPSRLELPLQRLERQPELQVICGGWLVADQLHQPWQENTSFTALGLLRLRGLRTGCLTLRRGAIEELGGFDTALIAAGGLDLVLRLLARGGEAAWLGEALMRYRPRHQWQGDPQALRQGLEQVLLQHGEGIRPDSLVELRFGLLTRCAFLAAHQQQPEQCRQGLLEAALSAPLPVPRARVQLLEQLGCSLRWCGLPAEPFKLLQSELWRASVALWP